MIRKANINDKSRIEELGIQVNKKFKQLFNIEDFLSKEYNDIFVYEEDNKIIALIMITCLYETCEIINIVVDKDKRNNNIASRLLEYTINNLGKEVNNIVLEVATNNEFAIKLYKKFDFEIINTRKNYYDGIDAYIMGVSL